MPFDTRALTPQRQAALGWAEANAVGLSPGFCMTHVPVILVMAKAPGKRGRCHVLQPLGDADDSGWGRSHLPYLVPL